MSAILTTSGVLSLAGVIGSGGLVTAPGAAHTPPPPAGVPTLVTSSVIHTDDPDDLSAPVYVISPAVFLNADSVTVLWSWGSDSGGGTADAIDKNLSMHGQILFYLTYAENDIGTSAPDYGNGIFIDLTPHIRDGDDQFINFLPAETDYGLIEGVAYEWKNEPSTFAYHWYVDGIYYHTTSEPGVAMPLDGLSHDIACYVHAANDAGAYVELSSNTCSYTNPVASAVMFTPGVDALSWFALTDGTPDPSISVRILFDHEATDMASEVTTAATTLVTVTVPSDPETNVSLRTCDEIAAFVMTQANDSLVPVYCAVPFGLGIGSSYPDAMNPAPSVTLTNH